MRVLIVTEFVSLDGVMEAPGGEAGYAHAGWVGLAFSDDLGHYKLKEQLATDALLLGRKTYEWMNTTVIDHDLDSRVGELKAQDGAPILIAGSRLADN